MNGDGERTEGGDPVCWLDRVCPQCGAFRETPAPRCARCGTPFPGTGLDGGDGDGDADRTGSPQDAADGPEPGRGDGAPFAG